MTTSVILASRIGMAPPAIPNFRLVWRPPYLPYRYRCHCQFLNLVADKKSHNAMCVFNVTA